MNALRHLDEGRDELVRERNRLRQEEIVEEIELMASGRNESASAAIRALRHFRMRSRL